MNVDTSVGLAFALYIADPCPATVEAVVVAIEGGPDMPVTPEQTRTALLAAIPQIKQMLASHSAGQTGSLMTRLLSRRL